MQDDRARTLPVDVQLALPDIIEAIRVSFADALIGVYLEGSFAWGNPVETSDLDLRIVTHRAPSEDQRTALVAITKSATDRLGREVAGHVDVLSDLQQIGAVRFQRALLLAGEDIRPLVPLKAIDAFVTDTMISAHDLIVAARTARGTPVTLPIGPPSRGGRVSGL